MTVQQIIREIEALPLAERKEVDAYFQQQPAPPVTATQDVRYLDREAAKPLIKEILQTHSELFQKLAK